MPTVTASSAPETASQPAAIREATPPPLPPPPPPPPRDSVEKLGAVLAACEELGVVVAPARLGRLQVVPLLAWHHKVRLGPPRPPGAPGIAKAAWRSLGAFFAGQLGT